MAIRTWCRKWKKAVVKWQKKLLLNGYNIAIQYVKDGDVIGGQSGLPSESWEWLGNGS